VHVERGANRAPFLLSFIAFALVASSCSRTQESVSAQTQGPKTNPKDGLRYLWIPPGSFIKGCSPQDNDCFSDEKPTYKVTLTKGFYLGETEVTQGAYQRVAGENPSRFKGSDLPVEQVSWVEANKYCRAIGGRLPSEAEWEYAARGGSAQSRYGDIDKIAWYGANSKDTTHPVGQKPANAFGLHDMLGNVYEWTNTVYTNSLSPETTDPKGPATGEFKTLRGGGWFDTPDIIRASYRSRIEDDDYDYDIGFRCVGE
jgi:formylglycine-generating enzyme required for sulfatase activity